MSDGLDDTFAHLTFSDIRELLVLFLDYVDVDCQIAHYEDYKTDPERYLDDVCPTVESFIADADQQISEWTRVRAKLMEKMMLWASYAAIGDRSLEPADDAIQRLAIEYSVPGYELTSAES